jgi:hypothetical protein
MFQMVQALQVTPGIRLLQRAVTVARVHFLHAGYPIPTADGKDLGLDCTELVF